MADKFVVRDSDSKVRQTRSRVSGKILVFWNSDSAKPGATVPVIGTVDEAGERERIAVPEATARRRKAEYEQAEAAALEATNAAEDTDDESNDGDEESEDDDEDDTASSFSAKVPGVAFAGEAPAVLSPLRVFQKVCEKVDGYNHTFVEALRVACYVPEYHNVCKPMWHLANAVFSGAIRGGNVVVHIDGTLLYEGDEPHSEGFVVKVAEDFEQLKSQGFAEEDLLRPVDSTLQQARRNNAYVSLNLVSIIPAIDMVERDWITFPIGDTTAHMPLSEFKVTYPSIDLHKPLFQGMFNAVCWFKTLREAMDNYISTAMTQPNAKMPDIIKEIPLCILNLATEKPVTITDAIKHYPLIGVDPPKRPC